jgi:hypothetical protein
MISKRELALQGLFLCLQNGLSDVAVTRNDPVPVKIPKTGLVILRDGDAGEAEITLSPTRYHYSHDVEIEVLIQKADDGDRDLALDALLVAIGSALIVDPYLNGAVDYMMIGSPEFIIEPVEGAPAIKAAIVPVTLEYSTFNPLQ